MPPRKAYITEVAPHKLSNINSVLESLGAQVAVMALISVLPWLSCRFVYRVGSLCNRHFVLEHAGHSKFDTHLHGDIGDHIRPLSMGVRLELLFGDNGKWACIFVDRVESLR